MSDNDYVSAKMYILFSIQRNIIILYKNGLWKRDGNDGLINLE